MWTGTRPEGLSSVEEGVRTVFTNGMKVIMLHITQNIAFREKITNQKRHSN